MKSPSPHYRKHKVWAIVLLLFFSSNSSATALDSLLNVLNKHTREDTAKVNLYAAVASQYRNASSDSMVAVAQRGLSLANKIQFEPGKVRCMASLGVAYMFRNELETADSICSKAIALLTHNIDNRDMSLLFYYMGNIRYRQTKYREAIEYFERAIMSSEKIGDDKMIARCLDNIGTSYTVLGKNTEALRNSLKALKVWEKIGNDQGMGACLSSIARVYNSLGDNVKALDYINQSIAILRDDNDIQTIIHSYMNAVSIYIAMNNDSASIAACTKAIRLADSTGQRSELTLLLNDRGMSYFHAGDYDKAFADYMKCLEPPTDRTAPSIIGQAHIGLGEVWMARGDARKSIPYLEIAYAIFRENEMDDQTGPAAEELGAAYEKVGDFKKALIFTKIGHAIKDSLFNEQNIRQQQQLQFDYELEKKQNQIGRLEKNKLMAQSKNEKQRAASWALFGGLALVVVIAIQLYRGRMREKRSKETIALQANNLEELNRFKDKIFSVMSHDLRGPIESISATVDMLDEDLLSPEEFTVLKPEMKKQLGALSFLLDNLLKWSKNHIMGGAAARPERIDLFTIARQNIALMQVQARDKNITVYNNIPEPFIAFVDPGHIDIIFRNLISNALKFTNMNGSITLSAAIEGDTARVRVSDNGVGMSPEQVKNLFLTTIHTSSFGTKGESGTGLGLLLCFEFAKANRGEILVSSEVSKGSTFTVVLPI
jgi:signal transduction histidine kinase